MTPLHSAALEALEAVKEVALDNSNLIPEVFDVMFKFSRSALTLSKSGSVKDGRFREKFSLFGEACLEFISTFYAKSCEVKKNILENDLLSKNIIKFHGFFPNLIFSWKLCWQKMFCSN